ncbi:MAG TPA: MBL fold metallo-hydrolase [Nitrospirota bacterium]|nr:MBL fold metallo-hydrolase [Nitrospirota bacterium]
MHNGLVSDHFDGNRFFNPEGGDHTPGDELKWFLQMKTVGWPEWLNDVPQPPPVERVGAGALRVTFINQATVLIQMDGLNIITDPIWSERAGPVSWLGAKRVRLPGVKLEQLPRIDYVLISHDHYDHLDLPTIDTIARRDQPTFLAGLGVGQRLRSINIRVQDIIELDWWQTYQPSGKAVQFVFVPARHQSGRISPFSRNRTLWGGFVIYSPDGQVYFAGDTGSGRFIDEIAGRFRRMRLTILPVGNYEKRWIMKTQHMNPDDAVRAHLALRAGQSMGIHYATFAEHPEQAIDAHERDLATALMEHAVPPAAFWILNFGEGRNVPPISEGSKVPEQY